MSNQVNIKSGLGKKPAIILVLCCLIFASAFMWVLLDYLSLNVKIESLRAENVLLKQQAADLEQQRSNLYNQVDSLQKQLNQLQNQLSMLQNQLQEANNQINELNSRLNNILGITIKQYYVWSMPSDSFWGRIFGIKDSFSWEIPIPLRLYIYYREKLRPASWSEYVYMARDPNDREYIRMLVQEINRISYKYGFSEKRRIEFVAAFIQSLPYTSDEETTPWNEYPRYPIETLFDRGGDCEDTSILAAALLREMGYDVALIFLPYEKHVAVGVAVSTYGSYYEYNGKKYFYLETIGEGWELGQIPSCFQDTRAYVFPVP